MYPKLILNNFRCQGNLCLSQVTLKSDSPFKLNFSSLLQANNNFLLPLTFSSLKHRNLYSNLITSLLCPVPLLLNNNSLKPQTSNQTYLKDLQIKLLCLKQAHSCLVNLLICNKIYSFPNLQPPHFN